jgi:hypothetical protein
VASTVAAASDGKAVVVSTAPASNAKAVVVSTADASNAEAVVGPLAQGRRGWRTRTPVNLAEAGLRAGPALGETLRRAIDEVARRFV